MRNQSNLPCYISIIPWLLTFRIATIVLYMCHSEICHTLMFWNYLMGRTADMAVSLKVERKVIGSPIGAMRIT